MTSSEDALEQLISQFAQPLAFLRELVQNSLDAGTGIIEVVVDYDQEADSCYVTVKDSGQGMDREIIDNRLTRLFSSTKEDDLTKIGKFGIGFVSIFAMKPKLVVMETGRDGEYWRVLFKPDRSFEKRELHHPVEGTSVTVYTPMKKKSLDKLTADAKNTVTFWCKHSDVEITFNGTPINQSFGFEHAAYQYRHAVEGTEVVLTPSKSEQGFQGYYNRGLTLLEGQGSPISYLSFKIRSRYLEHTLSRDNILQDSSYRKAMKEVERASFVGMPDDLFSQLAQSEKTSLWDAAKIVALYPGVRKRIEKRKIFPGHERSLSLDQLSHRVYSWPQVDDFFLAVERSDEIVLLGDSQAPPLSFLRSLGFDVAPLDRAFLRYDVVEMTESEQELIGLVNRRASHLPEPRMIEVKGQVPEAFKNRIAAFLDSNQEVRNVQQLERKKADKLALFRGHPLLKKLISLGRMQPELAVAVLLRKLQLDLGMGTKSEAKILNSLMKNLKQSVESK